MFGWGTILLGVFRKSIAEGSNTLCIRQMSIGSIAPGYKIPAVQFETETADGEGSVTVIIGCACLSLSISECISVVAAQAESQPFNGIIVNSGRAGIYVSDFVFVRLVAP